MHPVLVAACRIFFNAAPGLSCSIARGILVPQPQIESASPASQIRFFTTGPRGKSKKVLWNQSSAMWSVSVMTTFESCWEISLNVPSSLSSRWRQALPFLGELLWPMRGVLGLPSDSFHRTECHLLLFFIASLTQVGSFLFKEKEKFSLKRKILFSFSLYLVMFCHLATSFFCSYPSL